MKYEYPEEAIEKVREGLRVVARDEGMTEEEARKILEEYIAQASVNPNPKVRADFETCPRKGELPTVEEFLLWLLPQVMAFWEEEE